MITSRQPGGTMPFDLIHYSDSTVAGVSSGGEQVGLTDERMIGIISDMPNLLEREQDYLSTLNRSDNTIRTYGYALRRFNEIAGVTKPLSTESYVAFLKTLRDLSPTTQRVYRTAIRMFYDFCGEINERELRQADQHYLKKSGLRFPNPDMDAIERLIEYCSRLTGDLQELRDRAFVILLADTGLRISDACHLKRGDVDWKRERCVIVGKGDKQANVRLSRRALDALKDYLNARGKLDGATGKPLGSLPLFARHDRGAGNQIKPVAKGGMWFSIKGMVSNGTIEVPGRMREAGLDPSSIRIHDLRHYFVTRILQQTGNLKMAQELARHESVSVTQRYAHLSNEELDRGYDEIFNA